ncbi:MAG: hypothetical protein RL227_1896 [Pseudomonadota bacterium]|jgi:hypothetical protein
MSPSWIIATLLLLLLLAAGALWLRSAPKREAPALPEKWPLTARRVFGQHELRVYQQLREALPEQVLLSKLPLVRFCQPDDPAAVRYWYGLLANQHVSFAICSESGRVLAAIDLEGLRPSSRRSLQIKESVLAACKVKYLRFTPEQLPSVPELRALVPAPAGKSAPVARMAQASENLSTTVATRRRERQGFGDGNFVADSVFDDVVQEGTVSGFGLSGRVGVSVREIDFSSDEAIAAVVIDTPPSALRH